MVWSKLIWSVVLLVIVVLGYLSHQSNRRLPLSVDDVDTLAYYYSGAVDTKTTPHTFKDCATLATFSVRYKGGDNAVSDVYKGRYCQVRGYIDTLGVINIASLGKIRGRRRCLGISLCDSYGADGDTLTLYRDYSWKLVRKGNKEYNGDWAKLYYNQGVLLIGKKVYPFTINYGTFGSYYRTVLSFRDFNNKTFNFIPL